VAFAGLVDQNRTPNAKKTRYNNMFGVIGCLFGQKRGYWACKAALSEGLSRREGYWHDAGA
jgi:hypothetical protein